MQNIFAEISRKFSVVRWFNKTEDCIFPSSFILRSNVQSFNILPSFNLAVSLHLQYCSYLSTLSSLSGSTHPFCVYLRFPAAYLVHYKPIVLIFSETNAIKRLSHLVFMTRTVNPPRTRYSHPTLPNLPVVPCYNQ